MACLTRWVLVAVIACVGFAGATSVSAKGKDKKKPEQTLALKVKLGEAMPAFEGVDEGGKPVKSSDLVGKKPVVLFFFPADGTGDSVAQVLGYRDEMEKLSGAIVIGVSGDAVMTHKLFKSYYKLPFTLVSDEKGDIAKAFGVPVTKGGKSPTIDAKNEKGSADRAVTIARVTLVIDKTGKLAAADRVGKAGDDAKRVAEIVKKLDTK
ncbi:MAG: redoxin domain-containing protein [Planctomycetes bacterium]|nr:redoxin domain-containing protein [Planctomycetota bacterium]